MGLKLGKFLYLVTAYLQTLVVCSMDKRDTNFRNAIKVEKRVAVTLWRLSTGNWYRTVSKVFGIAKSVWNNKIYYC